MERETGDFVFWEFSSCRTWTTMNVSCVHKKQLDQLDIIKLDKVLVKKIKLDKVCHTQNMALFIKLFLLFL